MKKKPPCADFIVAAVRYLRPAIKNLTHGTGSGVAVRKIYKPAIELYTDQEFRTSLTSLMKNETVIVIWEMWENSTGKELKERVHSFSSEFPFDAKIVHIDGARIEHTRAYVKADGLPKSIGRLLHPRSNDSMGKTLAQSILESMKK